jgi:hypothetical protein
MDTPFAFQIIFKSIVFQYLWVPTGLGMGKGKDMQMNLKCSSYITEDSYCVWLYSIYIEYITELNASAWKAKELIMIGSQGDIWIFHHLHLDAYNQHKGPTTLFLLCFRARIDTIGLKLDLFVWPDFYYNFQYFE